MPRGRFYVVILVSLIVILVFKSAMRTSRPSEPVANAPASQRSIAPDLNLPLEHGKPPVSLASLKGKVVVLDFWATWCGPCRESIPELEQLYEKYHSKGLEVIGISFDNTAAPVPATVKQLGMTYPVVQAYDIPDVRSKFPAESIPQVYVIDKRGRIAALVTGAGHNLASVIAPLLAE